MTPRSEQDSRHGFFIRKLPHQMVSINVAFKKHINLLFYLRSIIEGQISCSIQVLYQLQFIKVLIPILFCLQTKPPFQMGIRFRVLKPLLVIKNPYTTFSIILCQERLIRGEKIRTHNWKHKRKKL